MSKLTILGDWGSTRFRLWRMADGEITGRNDGPGIGELTQSPEATLREALAPLLADYRPDSIVLCGMAGARNGLHEAPYAECPATAEAWAQNCVRLDFDGIPAVIAAGLACHDPALQTDDVMRGEETQVFGALTLRPELCQGHHLMVLPGTHAKWVTIENGCVTGLRTFMTGELFALLGRSSLLATGATSDNSGQDDGFAAGLEQAQSGAGLSGALFTARSAQLRAGRSVGWAKGFLSGLLIGHELAEMASAAPLPNDLTVIAAGGLSRHYLTALTSFGVTGNGLDGDACALAGLKLLDTCTRTLA